VESGKQKGRGKRLEVGLMELNQKKLDLRMLKYKNYIRRHPKKAYGYYCMGKLKLTMGQHKDAVELFNKALFLDDEFIYARIGLIECHIAKRRLVKASGYFQSHAESFAKKNIHMLRLVKAVSSYCGRTDLDTNHMGLFQLVVFRYEIFSLKNSYIRDPANIVTNLLLCINYLSSKVSDDKAMVVYNTCVRLDGLCDNMRWAIVNKLSKDDLSILENIEIAAMFDAIPDKDCPSVYINTIFEASLKTKSIKEIKKIFNSINENDKVLSLPNQWKYILKCTENSIYDISVYKCCKKLIGAGWVDNILAETLYRLKELKIIENTANEEKVLGLFGYNTGIIC
jgi:tetratricopeptide (TPR) repeat protein